MTLEEFTKQQAEQAAQIERDYAERCKHWEEHNAILGIPPAEAK